MKNLKIALIQAEQIQWNMDLALKKGIEYCNQSKEMGADIVLFPEMYSIGCFSSRSFIRLINLSGDNTFTFAPKEMIRIRISVSSSLSYFKRTR